MPNDNALTANKTFTSRKLHWINTLVADPQLSDLHCRAGLALSFYFNAQTGDCYVSQPTLAKRACCTDRAVRAATTALESAGYLSVQVNAGPNRTNRYRMINPVKVSQDTVEAADPEPTFLPTRNLDSAPPGTGIPDPPDSTFLQTPVHEHLCMNTCA